MLLKGNTHTHTTKSDGKYEIQEVIETYYKLKYDFLFLTDHNSPYKYEVKDYKGMIVFYGNEASNASDIQQHATIVKTKKQTLKIINHPIRYQNTPKEVEEMADKFGYDAVEVTQHGKLYPQYLKCDLPHVASDDSHRWRMVGDSYIIVEVPDLSKSSLEKDANNIIKAIKEGKVMPAGTQFDRNFVEHFYPKAKGII